MAVKKASTLSVNAVLFGNWVAALVIVLLPFHAVFTTWLGSNFGHLDAFRIWKELLIFGLAIVVATIVGRDKRAQRLITKDWLMGLILGYAVLNLVLACLARLNNQVSQNAAIYGLLANLRFLGFFVITYVLVFKSNWLRSHWPKLIFYPAIVVIVFGLLQKVLPVDFLRHLGYGSNTIPAVHTIDQKLKYMRIQSTLRGPNPLGTYLLLILSLATAALIRFKQFRAKLTILIAGGLIALFYCFSRSAWAGLCVSVFFVVLWSLKTVQARRYLLTASLVAIAIIAAGIWTLRNNDTAQNTLFHTNEASRSSESSNEARGQSLREGVHDVATQPFGRGPGTAGPASLRNDHPPRIAENYFLQIGQETGWIGFALFLVINAVIACRLYVRRSSTLALGLLAALIGLTLVNLVSHAWADDTLALLWWGLAGIALAPEATVILKR